MARMYPKTVNITMEQLAWLDENVDNQSAFIREAIDLLIEKREAEKE